MPPPTPPVLRLYDTRRDGIFPVEPLGVGSMGLYVCGITPYDTTHLGHAFTYLTFDVIHRYLEYAGQEVRYVQNVTDVDDDMLAHARDVGEDYLALGLRHAEHFLADMAELNWLPPDVYARATEHLPQMVSMIERLLTLGLAYVGDDHVYLSATADPAWGSLSHIPPRQRLALANERGNRPELPGKRDPLDPVLWQRSLPDEPAWPSPWGDGRPGWHIECSAMSVTHLGPQFEMHGGGRDLAFPHHEAERIQSEGYTDVRPVVRHWVHTGMVHSGAEKMSKSLGNLVMVRDLLDRWPADAVRLALVRPRYRDDLTWSDDLLASAVEIVRRWTSAVAGASRGDLAEALPDAVAWRREEVLAALANDLDTAGAVDKLDAIASLALGRSDEPTRRAAAANLHDIATRIIGLQLRDVRMTDLDNVPPSVRLGEVVPPEDPEDWGRPLTWVVAASMLAAPIIGAGWFIVAPPADPLGGVSGTSILAAVVAGSAAVTGSTQRGPRRALFATIGAGLFSALGLVVAGTVIAGGVALTTAALAAVAGVIGTVPAGSLAALVADGASRVRRIVSPTLVGAVTAVIVVRLLTTL